MARYGKEGRRSRHKGLGTLLPDRGAIADFKIERRKRKCYIENAGRDLNAFKLHTVQQGFRV